jgi:hypothetical protein
MAMFMGCDLTGAVQALHSFPFSFAGETLFTKKYISVPSDFLGFTFFVQSLERLAGSFFFSFAARFCARRS